MKSKQTALSLGSTRKAKPKPDRGFTYYMLGGLPWSDYIAISSVPLCTHQHGPVDEDTMGALVRKCMWPAFWSRRCLTAEWNGHAVGSEVLVYGTVGTAYKIEIWIKAA